MRSSGKVNVLILGILAGVCAVVAGITLFLEEQERHQRIRLEGQVAQLRTANQQLESDLQQTKEAKQRAEADLVAVQEEARHLAEQLAEIRTSSDQLHDALSQREQTIADLKKALSQLQADREQFSQRLSQLQEQLVHLQREKSALQTKGGGGTTIELEKVIVGPGGQTPPTGGTVIPTPAQEVTAEGTVLTGRILVVNREYDFVVMNVGKASGVQLGDEFDVVRGGQSLGRVKVEKLYEALAAAAILPETNEDSIREGDTVRVVISGS